MALRVFAYTALLWEDLIKRGLINTGGKLPPVLPIVIYNGESKWSAPERIQDLIQPAYENLKEYPPEQKYLLIDINRISSELLDKAEGESAFVFRFERAKNPLEILDIAREMACRLKDPKYDFLKRAIGAWLNLLLRKRSDQKLNFRFENIEDTIMLEERIARWEEELISKGRTVGKAEGKAEGIAESLKTQKKALLSMISLRFPDSPPEWKKRAAALEDVESVSKLMIALVTVKSSDEFGKLLMGGL